MRDRTNERDYETKNQNYEGEQGRRGNRKHCYPVSSQPVLNLTLALSWVQRGHLLKLCYKGHIRVLHLTVHELAFGGRNREKTEQARTYNLLHHNLVLYHCAISAYIR